MKTISIAKDFSPFPAGRFSCDGEFNGTRFREEFLIPALQAGEDVEVSLDGVVGLASSFLDEVFGGLLRTGQVDQSIVREHLRISTTEEELEDYQKLAEWYLSPE